MKKMKENENAMTVGHLPGIDPGSLGRGRMPCRCTAVAVASLAAFLEAFLQTPSPPRILPSFLFPIHVYCLYYYFSSLYIHTFMSVCAYSVRNI